MVVSGTYRFEMRGEKPVRLQQGDFFLILSRHISQTTCISQNPCLDFLYTDEPFDVHYVDPAGKEISLDEALRGTRKPPLRSKRK